MRVAFLDCFAGAAGDMFLGALLDAGVPPEVLHQATAALGIHASLRIETVDRSGIAATKVHVFDGDRLAEMPEPESKPSSEPQFATPHRQLAGHAHPHRPIGHVEQADDHETTMGTDAVHGRSLNDIRDLIEAAALDDAVKRTAMRTFELLGASEARIHNVPVEQIHFHEVGAVDAIVDIVASCAGIHHLGVEAWYSSPVNVGSGVVRCAHGVFPVPAPATADLLRGVPTYAAHLGKELVTPTGAALLRALNPTFGPQPPMRVQTIGYGAGTRNPEGFPNVLRLSLGELDPAIAPQAATAPQSVGSAPTSSRTEAVTVLETALDDASPQLLAYVAEQALAHGALDAMLTPVIMKKGRPGTLLTVLSTPANTERLLQLLLRETPTLGVRIREDHRVCLEREHFPVETEYGTLRVKLGRAGDQLRNAAPEFEDCKAAALRHQAPLKQVQQAAIAAFLRRTEKP